MLARLGDVAIYSARASHGAERPWINQPPMRFPILAMV
jgi:hypothetical protein